MAMKTILVPLERHDRLGPVFDCAAALQRRFGGRVEAAPVRSLVADIYIAGAFGGVPVPHLPANATNADDLRKLAAAEADRAGLGPAAYRWQGGEPLDDVTFAAKARAFDISVFGRPNSDGTGPRMGALETTLFESGRPMIIAPPRPVKAFGEKICIAWNGSSETARTIAFAMPFLERAAEVLVLSVEGFGPAGPTGAEIAAGLETNGVKVSSKTVTQGSRSPGQTFLEDAATWGADLLIKGAYTQSRIRQMIFGGATSHILLAAELPVFMAH